MCFLNSYHLHLFAKAAISKYYQLGGSNNKELLSQSSGSQKSEIKVLRESILSRGKERLLQASPLASGGML